VTFHEVSSDYFKDTYFAPRPPSERLINKKLELRKMNIMRDWRIALDEYVSGYFSDYIKANFPPKQDLIATESFRVKESA
jgi:hypothetical protein